MSTLGLHLLAAGIVVAALVGMSIRSLYRRCALVSAASIPLETCSFCPRPGRERNYGDVSATLCDCCAFDVEHRRAAKGEIEREVSTAINTMREP